ncbi:hypothetical protein GCWU000341_02610 [Oribacterium sp. oral taxon 078 str. F0262]|nr:hypothetical protein GCWU000341_02610 [Oribacterium sp. oral taxon 078 str. F0262]
MFSDGGSLSSSGNFLLFLYSFHYFFYLFFGGFYEQFYLFGGILLS